MKPTSTVRVAKIWHKASGFCSAKLRANFCLLQGAITEAVGIKTSSFKAQSWRRQSHFQWNWSECKTHMRTHSLLTKNDVNKKKQQIFATDVICSIWDWAGLKNDPDSASTRMRIIIMIFIKTNWCSFHKWQTWGHSQNELFMLGAEAEKVTCWKWETADADLFEQTQIHQLTQLKDNGFPSKRQIWIACKFEKQIVRKSAADWFEHDSECDQCVSVVLSRVNQLHCSLLFPKVTTSSVETQQEICQCKTMELLGCHHFSSWSCRCLFCQPVFLCGEER